MVNIYVPGLCGLSLSVAATTNGATWHGGIVKTETRAVELAGGEVIPASAIRRLCYQGEGTRIPFQEARSVILLLSMIGGVPHRQLLEMAWEGIKPKDPPAPKRPPGRPRKQPLPEIDPWREIPVGLMPSRVLPNGRLVLEDDSDTALVGE